MRVGNQKSRWGSCSSKGTISLNWRLLLLSYSLGQYVILHELAHLKHLNHSLAFWQYLESICPGARIQDRELRNEGKKIINLGQVRGSALVLFLREYSTQLPCGLSTKSSQERKCIPVFFGNIHRGDSIRSVSGINIQVIGQGFSNQTFLTGKRCTVHDGISVLSLEERVCVL